GRHFRTEVRVAAVLGQECRVPDVADRVPGADRVERPRRAAGLSICRAQLDGSHLGRPEVLLADDPGARDLRVGLEAEALAERAVPVHAEAERDEVLVGDVEHVLEEEARVPHLLAVLLGPAYRARADRRLDGAGEVLAVSDD